MRIPVVLTVMAVSAASVFAESAAGIRWTAPATWKAEAARPMRAATYTIPLAAGDQGVLGQRDQARLVALEQATPLASLIGASS